LFTYQTKIKEFPETVSQEFAEPILEFPEPEIPDQPDLNLSADETENIPDSATDPVTINNPALSELIPVEPLPDITPEHTEKTTYQIIKNDTKLKKAVIKVKKGNKSNIHTIEYSDDEELNEVIDFLVKIDPNALSDTMEKISKKPKRKQKEIPKGKKYYKKKKFKK